MRGQKFSEDDAGLYIPVLGVDLKPQLRTVVEGLDIPVDELRIRVGKERISTGMVWHTIAFQKYSPSRFRFNPWKFFFFYSFPARPNDVFPNEEIAQLLMSAAVKDWKRKNRRSLAF